MDKMFCVFRPNDHIMRVISSNVFLSELVVQVQEHILGLAGFYPVSSQLFAVQQNSNSISQ